MGKVVGYRTIIQFHPDRADWFAIGLDLAGTATLGLAGPLRAAYSVQAMNDIEASVSSLQMAPALMGAGSSDRTDAYLNLGQIAIGFASTIPNTAIQWSLSIISLGIDLREAVEVTQVRLVVDWDDALPKWEDQ